MWHTLISLTDLVISLLFFLGQCKQCYSGIHPSKCTFTSQVIDISKVSVGYVSRSGVAILLALFHNTYFYIYPIAWLANCLIWKKAYIIEFWQKNTLVITNPIFQQYKRRLYIWTSPDGWHWNQIGYILCSQRWRSSIQSAKTRLGADCGSAHERLIAKFRLKLKKVEKTTGPFRYDLNQIPYDYTVEVRNRFKGLDLIDGVPDELWMEVHDIVQETGIKTIPKKKMQKSKMAFWGGLTNSCEKKRSEKQRRKGKI